MFNESSEVLQRTPPKLRFEIDINHDISKFETFILDDINSSGVNFKNSIFTVHPELRNVDSLPQSEKTTFIKRYVNKYYKDNNSKLKEYIPLLTEKWEQYSGTFYGRCNEIFKGMPWPDGKYIGTISISGPMPRYLDQKTFDVPPVKDNRCIQTTAHEMMHFMFFEYVRKRYLPTLTNTYEEVMREKTSGLFTIPLWELSEIFNIVILSSQSFGIGSKPKPEIYKTDLIPLIPLFKQAWTKSGKNIDKLFTLLETKSVVETEAKLV